MRRDLTRRQREILRLVANGLGSHEIAATLGISYKTAQRTLSTVYRKLGARDRAQAVAVALAIGELGVHEIDIPPEQQEEAA